MHDLAVGQVRAGRACRVLTIDRDVLGVDTSQLAREESHDGIIIQRVRAIGGQRKQILAESPATVLRLLRWADVVHHHDVRFLFETVTLATALLIRRPLVVHTHGLILHTPAFARLKRLLLQLYFGPILSMVPDAIIADSRADAGALVRLAGVPGRRIRIFLNAIDLKRYRRLSPRPEPGRLLMFGRIDVHKGHDQLIEALALLDGDWRLDVVGGGPQIVVESVRERARRLGLAERITWHGVVNDRTLEQLLERAAVAVFPSQFEAFGLALLEAMAAGTIVVASDIDAHREVLGDAFADRLTELEAAPAAAALARALSLSPSDREILSNRVRQRAEEFSVERLIGQIDGLYRELSLHQG